ncbi:hypothetical protein DVH24_037058 [Malus domestica]|uniref:Uncharacterized protein n=1 Tax=Malus domestica TaxID=3750 RepID=A0A498HG20_MALDO|nr:hypothetical protein DVH24_037058 [Malus domestica]
MAKPNAVSEKCILPKSYFLFLQRRHTLYRAPSVLLTLAAQKKSFIYTEMNRVLDIAVSIPLHSELEGDERSTKVHKYICSLIAMLGGFLQLKQGARNESLFNTNYPAMVSLIVALIAYIRSLIGSRILHIILLLGTLSLILEVVILVLSLGLVAGFFWVVWFVKVVVEYACEFLKMLYKNAVASIIHTFSKLKDYLNMVI